jgi:hypothetical protein
MSSGLHRTPGAHPQPSKLHQLPYSPPPPPAVSAAAAAVAPPPPTDPVFVAVEEKLSASLNKDGGLEGMEVHGSMSLMVGGWRWGGGGVGGCVCGVRGGGGEM